MNDKVSFIPIGGIGNVTRNMYLYEYKDEILIIDCGLGFADETMLGVDLLLPDISYLLSTNLPSRKASQKKNGEEESLLRELSNLKNPSRSR